MTFYKGLNGNTNAVHEYDSFAESDSEGNELLRTFLYFSCSILVDVYLLTIFQ